MMVWHQISIQITILVLLYLNHSDVDTIKMARKDTIKNIKKIEAYFNASKSRQVSKQLGKQKA